VFRLAQFDQRVVGQVEVHNLIVLQVDVESELAQLLLNQLFGFLEFVWDRYVNN